MKTSTMIVLGLGLVGAAYLFSQNPAGAIASSGGGTAGGSGGQGGAGAGAGGQGGGTPFGGGTVFGTGTQAWVASGHGTQILSSTKGLATYPYFVATGGGFSLVP